VTGHQDALAQGAGDPMQVAVADTAEVDAHGDVVIATRIAAITAAQAAGRVRDGDPADLMGLIIAMACAWSPVSAFYAATAGEPAADHDRRRALLHDCVARAVTP